MAHIKVKHMLKPVHYREPRLWPLLAFCLLCLVRPFPVVAHPMGNFSINHFSDLEVGQEAIQLLYVIDMAEIPTFQETQQHRLTSEPNAPATKLYLRSKAKELTKGLSLSVNAEKLPLSIQSTSIAFLPGAGDLPTLRLEILFGASLPTKNGTLIYEDHNNSNRMGWREIIARPSEGMTLTDSSVAQASQSRQLTNYQEDLLQSPPQDHKATLKFSSEPTQHPATHNPSSLPSATKFLTKNIPSNGSSQNPLTQLMTTTDITFGMGIMAMAIALALGAFHALEPGHGKTLVAAYLVGSRGTPWHAILLGLTVTISHTIGVFALGGVTLFASHYFFPEQVYPWLGVTSGLLIMGTGILLLKRVHRTFRSPQHDLHHSHGDHHHPTHTHNHGDGERASYRSLLILGITGGMIPCPAALVVLLSAVSLNRIGFGMLLIIAFSLGLALVLTTIGILLVSAKKFVQGWRSDSPSFKYIPYVSPTVIIPFGLFLAIRSFINTGLLSTFYS